MDHQYYQPIWPLIEGAFDYTMNLAAELWSMIWQAREAPPPAERKTRSEVAEKENLVPCVSTAVILEVTDGNSKT